MLCCNSGNPARRASFPPLVEVSGGSFGLSLARGSKQPK
jgi:hypothetical protein